MAKVYKATVYYVDANDQIENKEAFKGELSHLFERGYMGRADLIVGEAESNEFEWHDDIDLNKVMATKETYEKYFQNKENS